MEKMSAYHQILCEYINHYSEAEFVDGGIFEYGSEEQVIIDVCKRANSDDTWSICLISKIKGASLCRIYTPIYEGLNLAMANILLDYARKVHQVGEKNVDNNQLLPQN